MAAKTKAVDGENLPSSAFLIVGDAQDTSTWHLPWKFSTDAKTKSHLSNAIARFSQVQGVSESAKSAAWTELMRLCKLHGVNVSSTMMPREGMFEGRGYAWLQVRSVNEDQRIIEGIATTPTVARDGDILETRGIKFKLPIPFLWRHKDPFGNVVAASVDDASGIAVRIQVGPPGVSQAIDEQWRMVKSGIVRGLSIGWRTIAENFDKAIGGYRITQSEWMELSAVPVPADANATITSIRSADEEALAALGRDGARGAERRSSGKPGVSGARSKTGGKMKSFEEKIRDLENRRKPIQERMTATMELTENESRELTSEEASQYDGDSAELKKIDTDLDRLRSHQQAVSGARPVQREAAEGEEDHSRSRVQVKKVELPKGNTMARAVICMIRAKGNGHIAAQLAKDNYKDTPEVAMYLRAVVDAGDTTTSGWASQLVPAAQQMQNDFLELLRPATLVGRIPNLRNVPFNVAVPLQSGGGTYGWVGESQPKPVTKLTVGNATLRWAKVAGIIVITKELARFSSPAAEAIIRDDMVKGAAQFIDSQFIDPSVAEVSNVSPGSITNGISAGSVGGTTAEDFRYDFNALLAGFIANNQDPSNLAVLMSATQAMALSLMVNSLGQKEFPDITMKGGTILGLPAIVSETVSTRIIVVNASDILLADDGGVSIDMSEQASIEMNTAPISGEESPITGAVLHSLWQRNEIGLRMERFITWKRARTSSVAWLDNVAYAPTQPS